MIQYRLMQPSDIEAGLMLCRKAGWNQLEKDWQLFLQTNSGGCWAAVSNNKLVGTVATISYLHHFSWIGMVLVHPDFRRHGIGLKLLQYGLYSLQDQETVKLDATSAGRELYLKLNFVDECSLNRMSTTAVAGNIKMAGAEKIRKEDIAAIARFDEEIFGANRQFLLEWMWQAAPEHAFVVKDQNDIQGYCLGRNGYTFSHIGPLVAKDIQVAKKLVAAVLDICAGQPIIMDVPHMDEAWMEWLNTIGFTAQRSFVRMYRGSNNFAGNYQKQFAITGPEFG